MAAEEQQLGVEDLGIEDKVLLSSLSAEVLNMRPAPVRIGRYTLLRRIGRGGMGTVYEAEDSRTGERCALKMLSSASALDAWQLKREFRAASDLRHPNLVQLYELGAKDDGLFFTMELVRGSDIVAAVRKHHAGGPWDAPGLLALTRLLGQLASALHYFHCTGWVHGDIKPSNVLVAGDRERVVLLDFGLSRCVPRRASDCPTSSLGAGTPGYMAPELATEAPSASSDWYSFGILMYLLLAGRMPDRRVESETARWPEVPGVPAYLSNLCTALIRSEPTARPSGEDILFTLEVEPRFFASPHACDLVGRESELRWLSAHAARCRHLSRILMVGGVSGIGKTALVQEFLRQQERTHGHLVFRGRCYEREAIRYKAIDGLIDDLATYLKRLPSEAVGHFLPRHIQALTQLFPRLLEVPEIRNTPNGSNPVDHQELRRRASVALRDLLNRIADLHPVTLWIDDLQWGDVDSVALLREAMRPPDALDALIVITCRVEQFERSSIIRLLREGASLGHFELEDLHVGALEPSDAEQMAYALLKPRGGERYATAIADEAGGHPLFLRELVDFNLDRIHAPRVGTASSPCKLDDLLDEKVMGLSMAGQELLRVVVIAQGPITVSAAMAAADGAGHAQIVELIRAGFVQVRHTSDGQVLDTLHDRIRESVRARLAPIVSERLELHLARTLEAEGGSEPEILARHFLRGGAPAQAYHYGQLAAAEAYQHLAFEKTVELCDFVLKGTSSLAVRSEMLRLKGHALRCLGRCEAAGRAYLDSAALCPTNDAAWRMEQTAAHELLRVGLVQEAMSLFERIAIALRVPFPKNRFRAIAWVPALRSRLWLLMVWRWPSLLFAPSEDQLDFCWALSQGFSSADCYRSIFFLTLHLRIAQRRGDAFHLTCALGREAVVRSAADPTAVAKAEGYLRRSREASQRAKNPYAKAWLTLCETQVAVFTYRLHEALASASLAEQMFVDDCKGVTPELCSVRGLRLVALELLGRTEEHRRSSARFFEESQRWGDGYAIATATGYLALSKLYEDRPGEALALVADANRAWPEESFHIHRLIPQAAEIWALLYTEQSRRAFDLGCELWEVARKNGLLHVGFVATDMASAISRAALQCLSSGEDPRVARRLDRTVAFLRRRSPVAAVLSSQFFGLRAAQRHDIQGATRALNAAAEGFKKLDMRLLQMSCRYMVAKLTGAGNEATAMEASLSSGEVSAANPGRLMATLAPGVLVR